MQHCYIVPYYFTRYFPLFHRTLWSVQWRVSAFSYTIFYILLNTITQLLQLLSVVHVNLHINGTVNVLRKRSAVFFHILQHFHILSEAWRLRTYGQAQLYWGRKVFHIHKLHICLIFQWHGWVYIVQVLQTAEIFWTAFPNPYRVGNYFSTIFR